MLLLLLGLVGCRELDACELCDTAQVTQEEWDAQCPDLCGDACHDVCD